MPDSLGDWISLAAECGAIGVLVRINIHRPEHAAEIVELTKKLSELISPHFDAIPRVLPLSMSDGAMQVFLSGVDEEDFGLVARVVSVNSEDGIIGSAKDAGAICILVPIRIVPAEFPIESAILGADRVKQFIERWCPGMTPVAIPMYEPRINSVGEWGVLPEGLEYIVEVYGCEISDEDDETYVLDLF